MTRKKLLNDLWCGEVYGWGVALRETDGRLRDARLFNETAHERLFVRPDVAEQITVGSTRLRGRHSNRDCRVGVAHPTQRSSGHVVFGGEFVVDALDGVTIHGDDSAVVREYASDSEVGESADGCRRLTHVE